MGSFVTKPNHDVKGTDHADPNDTDDWYDSEDSLAETECDISLDLDDTPDQYEDADLDFSQFPFSHPRVFSQMIMSLDSQSLLGLRLVCSTWLRWMNQCRVWSRALPMRREAARLAAGDHVIRNMRLDRIEALPAGTEEECRRLCIRMDRVAGDEVPPVEEARINLVEQLHLAVAMGEMDGPVMGPVEIFVRVKVDHPLVKQIVKENIVRFLNSNLVDENDRRALMMWRKYPVLCSDGVMLPISFQEPIEEAKLAESPKRIRVGEDLENQELNISKVEVPSRIHPDFPTMLELLDIDDPIVKTMLIQKTGIDNILACPRFNDIMSQPMTSLGSLLKVQGVGMDGKVCEVSTSVLNAGGVAVMGYHVNQCFSPRDQAKNLVFWGGPDIRHNWPAFAKQLKEIDSNVERKPSPLKKSASKPSDPEETSACMARLAARGLISTGKLKQVEAEPNKKAVDDESFYPFSSLAKSDPFSANPVSDELYTSLASRGLSLSMAQPSTSASRNVDENGSSGSDQGDGDHPGDVIIYDRGEARSDTSGLRAMLEARGMLRIDGGRATLRMEGFQENDEDSDDSDWDEEEEETDEEDTEDDEDTEEWYRNYMSQRASAAQEGDDDPKGISDDSMGKDLAEDDDSKRILDDSKRQDLTEDEISAVAQSSSLKIVDKALELPIINDAVEKAMPIFKDAVETATKLHKEAATFPYVNQVDTIIVDLINKAETAITPYVSSRLTRTVAQLDNIACTGLDKVTAKVPSLKQPTGVLYNTAVNLANAIVDVLFTFTAVQFFIALTIALLGFVNSGMETCIGLTEAVSFVKPVQVQLQAFKTMLEAIVERNDTEVTPAEEVDDTKVIPAEATPAESEDANEVMPAELEDAIVVTFDGGRVKMEHKGEISWMA